MCVGGGGGGGGFNNKLDYRYNIILWVISMLLGSRYRMGTF